MINPVPAPIAPGVRVGISLFGQAQETRPVPRDRNRTRLQGLRPVPDASGRLFVHDTRGTISVVGASGGTPQTWFDIRTVVPGFSNARGPNQSGLMSFAFHPNFAGNPAQPGYGVFYTIDTSLPTGTATLTGKGPTVNNDNILHEFRVADPGAATATIIGQREVLRMAQTGSGHGLGTVGFNPLAAPGSADYGNIYISQGDGGGVGDPFGNAQDLTSPLGKILRINPAAGPNGEAYTIPADNPFVGEAGKLGEIWASGLRNPQQFSWDSSTGRMLIIDIGQSRLEEVNVGVAGGNYGWPLREGTFARGSSSTDPNVYTLPANDGSFVDPISQFDHEELERTTDYTLTGIGSAFAYTGSAVPELFGKVVLTELVSGRIFYFDQSAVPAGPISTSPAPMFELGLEMNGVPVTLSVLDGNPLLANRVDLRLGTDGNGELFLLSKTHGNIYAVNSLLGVPEPQTWAMLLAGFGLVGALQRRERKAGRLAN